jgi:hypothetical protein
VYLPGFTGWCGCMMDLYTTRSVLVGFSAVTVLGLFQQSLLK